MADVVNSIVNFVEYLRRLDKTGAASLTKYINDVNVVGKVYIEESVASDAIAIPLMQMMNQMYVCWILCALGLDSQCMDGRTVNDRMRVVSGLQSLESDLLSKIEKEFGSAAAPSNEAVASAVTGVDPETQHLACGRLVEFDFNTRVAGSSPNEVNSLKAYFYVQLFPYLLRTDVCRQFLGINFTPSIASRWAQYRAGEITFWKDFICARDILKKEREILKKDKSGVILDMMNRQTIGPFRWLMGLINPASASHNLANAMLVFDKQSFDISCREAGVNFDNNNQRTVFFQKTWTTAVIVVDMLYGRVQMYYAGVPLVGNYTFDMINRVGSKGKDSFDLKEIMTALSSGQAPKF